jgi:hypothetical protein
VKDVIIAIGRPGRATQQLSVCQAVINHFVLTRAAAITSGTRRISRALFFGEIAGSSTSFLSNSSAACQCQHCPSAGLDLRAPLIND